MSFQQVDRITDEQSLNILLVRVSNALFHCQTTSWNIFSRLFGNQFRLDTVNDGLRLLKIVSCY